MMDDVVIITRADFLSLKTIEISHVLDSVTNILLLDCFNESKAMIKYNNQFKNFNQKKKVAAPSCISKHKGFLSREEKINREVILALNILNKTNTSNIFPKLKLFINEENKPGIIRTILEKGVHHLPYLNEYLDLIHYISNGKEDPCLVQAKEDFFSAYLIKFDKSILDLEEIDYDKYDDFCKFKQIKKMMLNHVALFTNQKMCNTVTLQRFIEYIQQHIHHEKKYIQDIIFEIFLKILNENHDMKPLIKGIFKKVDMHNISLKTKFAIEAIKP